MKIIPVVQNRNDFYYQNKSLSHIENLQIQNRTEFVSFVLPNYYRPLFKGAGTIATKPFLTKINNNKTVLLRKLDEILKTKPKDMNGIDIDFLAEYCSERVISTIEAMQNRLLALKEEMESIANDNRLKYEQKKSAMLNKNNQFQELKNKCKKIIGNFDSEVEKRMLSEIYGSKSADEDYDYELINKFKCAIQEDNYDLDTILAEHYAPLKNITTIAELRERFPKIKIPPRPEEVISKKIIAVLTRDFYLKMDEYAEIKDISQISNLISEKLISILKELAKKDSRAEYLGTEIFVDTFTGAVADNYKKLFDENRINTIPLVRKNTLPDINDLDYKMLSINYDGFITSAIEATYLKGIKPTKIEFHCGDVVIDVANLRDTEYKFEKFPDRIRRFITDAKEIKEGYRNYDKFNANDFKERFNFYANTEIADNEVILETIMEFLESPLVEADFVQAKQLLTEFDKIMDGKTGISEVAKLIERENILPHNRKILNQKELEEQHKKQETALAIKKINLRLENAINTLYSNDLNSIAQICKKYKIESLDSKKIEYIDLINRIVEKNISTESGHNIIKNSILNLETYINAIESDNQSPRLADAITYACKNGLTDKLMAGQYLRNAQKLLDNEYGCTENSLISGLKKLEQVSSNEKIIGLCKYEDFMSSQKQDECSILDALKLYDKKSTLGKYILNYIVENEYINKNTVATIKNATRGNASKATITPSAKRQILDKYKTTGAIDIFEAFEEALGMYARHSGSSGIMTLTSNNNRLQYEIELKIYRGRTTNRLFSSNNDYIFDIFDVEGLH